MEKPIYVKYANDRSESYSISTRICINDAGEKYVIKKADTEAAKWHIKQLYENYINLKKILEELPDNCYKLNQCTLKQDEIVFEYVEGQNLEQKICQLIKAGLQDEADVIIKQYVDMVRTLAKQQFVNTASFEQVFGMRLEEETARCMPITDIDLNFNNIMLGHEYTIIDYEWVFYFPIPVDFVIYRALYSLSISLGDMGSVSNEDEHSFESLCKKWGISVDEISVYRQMEQGFQNYVNGNHCTLGNLYLESGKKVIDVSEAVTEQYQRQQQYNFQIFYNYGEGYKEEDSVIYNVQPEQGGKIHLIFDIPENVVSLRIDPGNHSCMLTMEKCDFSFITNGCALNDKVVCFVTDDPQIYIESKEQHITQIDVQIFLEIMDKTVCECVIQEHTKNNEIQQKLSDDNLILSQEKQDLLKNIEIQKQDLEQTERLKRKLELQFEEQLERITKMKEEKDNITNALVTANSELAGIRNDLRLSNEAYQQILASGSWKVTAPMRSIRRFVIRHFNNRYTRQFMRGLHSLERDGVGVTAKKVKRWMKKKRTNMRNEQVAFSGIVGQNARRISEMQELDSLDKTIAVQLHLYYEDLLEEFCEYLNHIPYDFDLYISCQETANKKRIQQKAEKIRKVKKVVIRGVPNRGRDIAPVFVWFADELSQYDYMLHMHSKKSLYTGSERKGWRQYSLDSLIGNESLVRKVFGLLENEKGIGLVYPDNHEDVPMLAYSWLANDGEGRRLLNSLNIPFEGGIFSYPAGSFYIAKVDAIRPLFDRGFMIEDFPEEAGQTDGTLAHAIERGIAFVAKHQGKTGAIVDYREDVIRIGSSNKAFRPYYGQTKESVKEQLSQYDVISFDIFDTLITRCVLRPDDLFVLMQRKIKEKYDIEVDYLKVRKQAESLAWQKKNCYTNIHDIYEELPALLNISHSLAMKLKQLEIDTEIELVMPRRDVLEVYNTLRKIPGKQIIFVSDMYLTGEIIGKMLTKCGYKDWDALYVSCECGLRKDADTIWNDILSRYGALKFIHVGDNPRSDWQTLIDRRNEAMWIINSFDAFKMDESYNALRDIVEKPGGMRLEDSLILGMTVNGGIYNSPWVGTPYTGIPEITDAWTLGYSSFGHILTNYIRKIDLNAEDNQILLFLAREGYLLQKLYHVFHEASGLPERENYYFEASRRCVTVAAAKDIEDVKEIIGQYYRGKLSNMLQSRLGIDLPQGVEDVELSLDLDAPENTLQVMKTLKPFYKEMFEQFATERQAYLQYITQLSQEEQWNRLMVIDVGYSGTIQYFLCKLLDEKVGGFYLATFKTKPDILGCVCKAVYDKSHQHIQAIGRTQLFLESVLQAPYGQLVRFDIVDGIATARHKKPDIVSDEIISLQQGILDYCAQFGTILKDLNGQFSDVDDTVIRVYDTFLHGKYMSSDVAAIFGVEDDYCSNKTLRFNRETDQWL